MSVISDFLVDQGELGQKIDKRLTLVENKLQDIVCTSDYVTSQATSHLVVAGGKRIRPILCLLAAELGENPDCEEVLDAAVVVELTHLASLYHDDVMDEAPLRRGIPATHEIFGNCAAIMAGDVLFAKASKLTAELGIAAVKLHALTYERLCNGQLHETMGPTADDDPIAHYIEVLANKTGSLIAAAGRHGVMAAQGDPKFGEAIAQYAERIGVAFQLVDDVIDLAADSEVTGKSAGTDLLEGVPTMPTLLLRKYAAEGTLDLVGQEILTALDSGDLAQGDNLARTVALLREHAVVQETRDLANKWVQDSLIDLAILPEGEIKDAFTGFANIMINRSA